MNTMAAASVAPVRAVSCVRARYQRDAARASRAEGESSGRDAEIERAEAAGGLGGGWGEGGGGRECGGEG